ncbi:ATP-binding protein [Candidatus Pacearchaeota archaeon]|nr:ATP-binding protein [Candidatus Pacearchaeota archaeon]
MEKAEILNVLNDWNFWKKEQEIGIKRKEIMESIEDLLKTKEIVVIKGIRRSGKSTSLLQFCKDLIDSGVDKKNILIINLEDPRLKDLSLDLLNNIYELYLTELQPDQNHYVILDEVQVIDGWEKFARFLHENKKINVFVTGSSSKLLNSEYSTVLAGRHLDLEIRPLSFKEYLAFKGIEIRDNLDISNKRHLLKAEFKEYLLNGGFPKVILTNTNSQKKELLQTYFRDIIIKDIVQRYNIREVNKLNDLAKYYLTNVSTLQSFNNIKNVLKLNLDTVERFSYYLSSVYLLNFVKKFSYSEKEQLLNLRKVYCTDNGLRNSVAFVFSKDYGRFAENIAFNNLNKEDREIYYWRNAKQEEVDFVIRKKQRIIQAVQVSWDVEKKETKEREVGSLVRACKELKLKEGFILTEDTEKEEKVDRVKIKFIPLWRWLLEKR